MKTRSLLIIILTLIIGFVIGILTSAQLRMHRLNPVRVYFSEQRFRDGFYNAIQPTDQQKTVIREILEKYAKRNSEIQGNFREEMETSMKEFRKELDSHLTKEQLSRLKEMDSQRDKMIRNNRKFFERDSTNLRQRRHFYPGHRPGGMRDIEDSVRSRDTE
jgi:hypothetical protein